MKKIKKLGMGLLVFCMVFCTLTMPAAAASKGLQTENGKLYYYNSKGKKVKNKLVNVKGEYYYFGKKGAATKGLKKIKNSYYYFDAKYRRVRGKTVKIKGKKYYFSDNGKAIKGAVKLGKKIWASSQKGLLKKNITAYSREGKDFDAFIKVAGKPFTSMTAPSCNGPGDDGIYQYSNFTVCTYEENGVRTITFIY